MEEHELQVEVPSYFVCPISLQMMRDPVTLPTGITYDRDGIERWLLAAGTCPLTKQPVPPESEPTPNHTLRRLIQSWCADHGVDLAVVPTTRSPVDRARLADLVSCLDAAGGGLLDALIELREVADEGERNRKLLAAVPGAGEVLAAVVVASCHDATAACDVALGIVSSMQLPEQCVSRLAGGDGELVDALVATLRRPNATSRAHAAAFLGTLTASMAPNRLTSLPDQVFDEMTRLLRDSVATRSALHVLVSATPWGRNRVKAVEAGAVDALIDMLLDLDVDATPERRVCELAMAALDRMCGCAEGRAALVSHGAGVAVVGRSLMSSERAVRVVRSVARHAATAAVLQEMAQTGIVAKLSAVARSERCSERTRERARETLRLHAAAWRNSPCLLPRLQAIYPSS
uniref:U-box domain-containing protein n=1 Tax=Leersia perrieri TaxID=77586 RepID=A0A0D9WBF2_9ORYZ